LTYLEGLYGLAGKTALVTGGASGIGRAIAESLVRAGARVLISSRKPGAAEQALHDLNTLAGSGSAEAITADVSTEAGVDALADEVRRRCQRLSVLVNNAGTIRAEQLEQFPYGGWSPVLAVNVAGLFTLTQRLLPVLRAAASHEDPARVINVGSVAGTITVAERAYSYSASKAAVHHLTRILAKELSSDRITVNALAPGPFVSRMTAFAVTDVSSRAQVESRIPLGRLGRMDDLAGTVLYLCGRGGSYTTGAIIPLDGGLSVGAVDGLWHPGGR
jgi:NAD(P)-dependent dehydrogenase (short-subunit alcohol dehydrogenase family)